ncbi:hypothetical protein Pstr01_13410 [Pseudomonas straminea]|nr:hypothetical protein Pstr01_13410 [Pseudomonas straminea]
MELQPDQKISRLINNNKPKPIISFLATLTLASQWYMAELLPLVFISHRNEANCILWVDACARRVVPPRLACSLDSIRPSAPPKGSQQRYIVSRA